MTLKQWLHRKLTLMGKITVVKTFALPKLIYPLTVLNNPNIKLIEDIHKYIFNLSGMVNLTKLKDVYYISNTNSADKR